MPAEMQGQNWSLVAENALKQLVDIQSMIDIMSERLVALRDLRLQEFIKQEIRSLEGKLIKHFWKQLTTKFKVPKDHRTASFQTYPSLSQWLTVVGVNKCVNERLIAEALSVETLLEFDEEKLSEILTENGGDDEDKRKLNAALNQLKDFNERETNGQQDTEGVFWDSWSKASQISVNGIDSLTNSDVKSEVDYNENIQRIDSTNESDKQKYEEQSDETKVRKHEILVHTVSGRTTAWNDCEQRVSQSPHHSSRSSLSSGGPPSPPYAPQFAGGHYVAGAGGSSGTPPATANVSFAHGYRQGHGKEFYSSSSSTATPPLARSNKMLESTPTNLMGIAPANTDLLMPFGAMRPAKSYEWQVGNRINAAGDESLTNSNLSLTSITTLPPPSTSGSKLLFAGRRKTRPKDINIYGNKKHFLTSEPPDLIDLLRPGNRNISQPVNISPESGPSTCTSDSPMSPRTPMTPATPFNNEMWMQHKDYSQPPQTPKTPSRFKGLRAIKDRIKDKIGFRGHKLRRNKSEERVAEDEAPPPPTRHKARSETFPLINVAGVSLAPNATPSNDKMLGPRHDDSRHNSTHSSTSSISESRQHLRSHHESPSFDLGLLSSGMTTPGEASLLSGRENFGFYYFESSTNIPGTDKTSTTESDQTVINAAGDASATEKGQMDPDLLDGSEGESTEALEDEHTMRVNLMRQGSTTSTMHEEWDIPWQELDLGEVIGKGRVGTVYKGKWHGEVAIRVINICHNDDSKLRAFKHEVMLYKKTRHDNVELFMGSCMNPPDLAIVTGFCRGKSLYHYIRASKEQQVNHNQAKIIAQHIAQGMGYLHSRGIIHKDLKSKNIFIDGKRVVVTDFGLMGLHAIASRTMKVKPMTLQIPDGWLCYMSPEVIRALSVPRDGIDVVSSLPYTKESDVYAFGTVWYELLAGCWPFKDYPAEYVIWQVGNGKKQSLSQLQGPKELKEILMKCWAYDSLQRPDFSDAGIMGKLLQLPQAKIYRRSSQPIKGNKKGGRVGGIGTHDRLFEHGAFSSVLHELAE